MAAPSEMSRPPDYKAGVSIHDLTHRVTSPGTVQITVTRGPGRISPD